jgi:transposase-like protein
VIKLQQIFNAACTPEEYAAHGGKYPFPLPPLKCPHCRKPGPMRKHGFYTRNYLGEGYCGAIQIRRYICPHCGRTVSMLPGFCHRRFQYSPVIILETVITMLNLNITQDKVIAVIRDRYGGLGLERQHLRFYQRRLEENIELLEYAARLVKSDFKLGEAEHGKRKRVQTATQSIMESCGMQAFWNKACIDEGIAILAHHTS